MKGLLVATFLGVLSGVTLRTGSAFKELDEGLSFMAGLAVAFSLGRALVSFLSSEAVNKYGGKVTASGFAALSAIGLGYYLAPPSAYPALRLLHGLASGLTWPSMQALVMMSTKDHERARVSSLYFFVGNAGASLAYLIGALAPSEALLTSSLTLLTLSIYLFKESDKIKFVRRTKRGLFAPPPLPLLMMAISIGMLNVLVNSEIIMYLMGSAFGRWLSGALLSAASAAGSAASYFAGRALLDVRQSPASLFLPAAGSLVSSSFLLHGDPKTGAASVLFAQGFLAWWRSALTAAARAGDVGKRIGLINLGRDLGNVIGGITVSFFGTFGILMNIAICYVLTATSAPLTLSEGARKGDGGGGPAGI
ncbi:MFS transporter [Ignicoccus hospitalis]|uniref:Major facilitator superfamily MFS_1 n=1 Tax=Ignicoccus hospitalis (strain KIN4/I / DSM 18386 / JCM 14125) TaxID=453591 RepID=A8A9Y5_IGNH4|nr:MFS transporter [Ignicoccus hospitalis]ABU81737.1 major facilitator superfamily MFS_1 [Ignicoccus hospitalis KIN4/I]HIH90002.1 MFS transporter [Desulfurococcaceae archaeon]